MKRVTAIGGIFFKTKDPEKIRQWYSTHLGIKTDQYGACFDWRKPDGEKGFTVWSAFKDDTKYFQPSEKESMINYRVENLCQRHPFGRRTFESIERRRRNCCG